MSALDVYAEAVVDGLPPLTEAQRLTLAALLAAGESTRAGTIPNGEPTGGGRHDAAA